MGFLQREKSLAELEEEKEHEEAEVSVLQQRVLKRQLEEKMGKGGLKYFKGSNGQTMWSKVYAWLKSH